MARALPLVVVLALLAACGSSERGNAPAESAARPPAPPAGRIAYACGEPPHICAINADGTGGEQMTGDAFHDEIATWTPDGGSLIVTRLDTDSLRFRLIRFDLASGAETPLTPRTKHASYGSLSPDGDRLLFVCEGENDTEICLADSDGSNIVVTNPTAFFEMDPAWSPDGRWIAFTRMLGDVPHVFVMDADGANEQLVAMGLTPAWSPDRTTLVVSRDGLWTIDVETGDEKRLTDGHDTEPSWSPDGRWIVFRRGSGAEADIYIVGSDGRELRRLTDTPGLDVLPFWAPEHVR